LDLDISTVLVVLVGALSKPVPLEHTSFTSYASWKLKLNLLILASWACDTVLAAGETKWILIEASFGLFSGYGIWAKTEFIPTLMVDGHEELNVDGGSSCVSPGDNSTIVESSNFWSQDLVLMKLEDSMIVESLPELTQLDPPSTLSSSWPSTIKVGMNSVFAHIP